MAGNYGEVAQVSRWVGGRLDKVKYLDKAVQTPSVEVLSQSNSPPTAHSLCVRRQASLYSAYMQAPFRLYTGHHHLVSTVATTTSSLQ